MILNKLKEKLCAPLVWGNCLGLVIVTTALLLAASFYLDSYTLHGETLSMPDVKGTDAGVAVRKLEAAGLRAERVSQDIGIAEAGRIRSVAVSHFPVKSDSCKRIPWRIRNW